MTTLLDDDRASSPPTSIKRPCTFVPGTLDFGQLEFRLITQPNHEKREDVSRITNGESDVSFKSRTEIDDVMKPSPIGSRRRIVRDSKENLFNDYEILKEQDRIGGTSPVTNSVTKSRNLLAKEMSEPDDGGPEEKRRCCGVDQGTSARPETSNQETMTLGKPDTFNKETMVVTCLEMTDRDTMTVVTPTMNRKMQTRRKATCTRETTTNSSVHVFDNLTNTPTIEMADHSTVTYSEMHGRWVGGTSEKVGSLAVGTFELGSSADDIVVGGIYLSRPVVDDFLVTSSGQGVYVSDMVLRGPTEDDQFYESRLPSPRGKASVERGWCFIFFVSYFDWLVY